MNTRLVIPVMADARLRGWPKHENGGAVLYTPVARALTAFYTTDAHTTAYSVPTIPRRLTREAMAQIPDGVEMVLAIFDFDASGGHGADGASDEWWTAEKVKIAKLLEAHPGAFVYRTRGGYRVVYLLAAPFLIRQPEDAAAWTALYLGWTRYLARRFGVMADPACKDWQRLYRLPHATRDAATGPERRETVGDATAIDVWSCELDEADRITPPKPAKLRAVTVERSHTGRGRLVEAFANKGWLGSEIETGKYAARCPWSSSHSKGEDYDGSTIVYAAGDGDLGWWHCSHAHCDGRTLADVLAVFSSEELGNAPRCGAQCSSGKACAATVTTAGERCEWHSVARCGALTRGGKLCAATELETDGRCELHSATAWQRRRRPARENTMSGGT